MSLRKDNANHEDWGALPADYALRHFESRLAGLSEAEVAERLKRYGPNRLPAAPRRSALVRLLLQFNNVLIYVLLVASLATALLGHWVDTGVIIAVVMINATIGFIQEGRAEQAMDAVRKMLSLHATVMREGRRVVVQAEDLVPGDIVILQSGDKTPADLRFIRTKNLQIQEAALTGESVPVEKSAAPVPCDAPLGDRSSMAYSSTLVTYGQGTGVVVATGAATEIGRISAMLSEVQQLTTPFLQRMSEFGRWLTVAILLLAGLTFAIGVSVWRFPVSDMFMAAVGLAVAAIPEGLPAVITITLAIGVRRMARHNAIIRRLPAVETLGSVATICTDKTGTLTRNEMTVRSIVTRDASYETSGVGYDPRGAFSRDEKEVSVEAEGDLAEMLRGAALCNDAALRDKEGAWSVDGDPMEGALLTAAVKAGLDLREETKQRPREDEIPFESEHRFMATLHHDHAGNGHIYVKGAPERLLNMCRWERVNGAERPVASDFWLSQIDEVAAKGQRVLAIAVKRVDVARCELTHDDVESGLILLGLFGLIDPPREEAIIAIRECHAAGVAVKMITGDHAMTATAIARDLELVNPDRALTGGDLEQMTDEALRDAVLRVNVFARASPEHKLRLVQALQYHGQVVAMTGDGVNDAPALKRADIGIAMGLKGTEAAKEASEMVLADDNFASIEHAVREGRTVYDNLKKTILYLLPISGAQAMTVIVAVMIGETMPILPVQILWVNLVDGVTLGLALAFERAEPGIMNRPPRSPNEPLLSRYFVWRIAIVSFIGLLTTFGLFEWELARGSSIETARTAAVNTLVASGVGYLFCVRMLSKSSASIEGFFGSRVVLMAVGLIIVFQATFTYFPPMETFFGSRPLDIAAWGRIAAVAVMLFVLVELEKAVVRNWRAASTAAPKSSLGWQAPAAAFALLAAAGGWFVWSNYPDRATRYETQSAERGAIVRAVSATGVIRAAERTAIGASASGVIQEVLCEVGAKVKAGQVCAKIDPRPLQAAVDREKAGLEIANARLAESKANAEKAKAKFERDQIRERRRLISRAALDRSRKAYERAQARTGRSEALAAARESALRAAMNSLDNADIVAPFDGTVVERDIERGRSVKADPNARHFLIAADLDLAHLDANVSEEDIGEVKVGDAVRFTVGSLHDRQFTGKVTQIDPTPRTIDGVATHRVVVSAPDPDRLLEPGTTAAVAIVVEQRQDVLRIPLRALHFAPSGEVPASEQPGDVVASRLWVLRGREPKAVSVRLGVSDGAHQEVVGGDLQPGDELIVGERGRDMAHKGQMAE